MAPFNLEVMRKNGVGQARIEKGADLLRCRVLGAFDFERGIAPANVAAETDHVKVGVAVLDEAFGVEGQALGFEAFALTLCEEGCHGRADPRLSSHDPMPWEGC